MRSRFLVVAAAMPCLASVLVPGQVRAALPPQDIGGHRGAAAGCSGGVLPSASREVRAVMGLVRGGATFSRPVEVDLRKNVIRMTIDGKQYTIRLPEAARARLAAAAANPPGVYPARGCDRLSEKGIRG